MTTNRFTYTSSSSVFYAYERNFQLAVNNLDEIIREERLQKRIKKSKDKPSKG